MAVQLRKEHKVVVVLRKPTKVDLKKTYIHRCDGCGYNENYNCKRKEMKCSVVKRCSFGI